MRLGIQLIDTAGTRQQLHLPLREQILTTSIVLTSAFQVGIISTLAVAVLASAKANAIAQAFYPPINVLKHCLAATLFSTFELWAKRSLRLAILR